MDPEWVGRLLLGVAAKKVSCTAAREKILRRAEQDLDAELDLSSRRDAVQPELLALIADLHEDRHAGADHNAPARSCEADLLCSRCAKFRRNYGF